MRRRCKTINKPLNGFLNIVIYIYAPGHFPITGICIPGIIKHSNIYNLIQIPMGTGWVQYISVETGGYRVDSHAHFIWCL